MNFQGLQKLTLLDFPGKMACTLFTGGCNLRCPFCHNSELVLTPAAHAVSEEEILSFLARRKGVLEGVCVTGGEPLLQPGLENFLASVKEMGYSVKLDTNGCFPDRLRALISSGLVDYVAMDVKNSPAAYGKTVGIEGFDLTPVRESVALLLEGRVAYEFRTTVVKELHTEADLLAIAEWIAGAPGYALQKFTDSGAILCPGLSSYTNEELQRMTEAVRSVLPSTVLRGV